MAESELEAHVRRVDPDRWLAARLVADPMRRAELLALYALNDALARVAESVSQPLIGEMRLAWWREQLDAAQAGRPPRGHPVLEAVAPLLAEGRLPRAPLDAIIDARIADLEPAPCADEAAVTVWLDGTAGALMWAAAVLLAPTAERHAVISAGRAWGWAGLVRATPSWEARGRRWAPGVWDKAEVGSLARARVDAALAASRDELRKLPVAAFPAVAYAAFARDLVHGRRAGGLARRGRLLIASATGRL